jgi:YqaJ-like viral recombinase domain
MPKIYWDIDQQSAAWFKLHSTIPTSSRFSDVMTPKRLDMSASRKKYACQIIAARLLNWQADSLSKIQHIEDGRRKEPIAVAQLELVREVETKKVGFITTNDGRVGASPDRVVMSGDAVAITVEAKCPTIPVQLEYLLAEQLAAMTPVSDAGMEYKCQRQGHLLVAEADEAIFYSYNERTPACYVRSYRDEPFIKRLDAALQQFNEELEMLTDMAKRLGSYQEFAAMVSPAEAEYGDRYRPPTEAEVQHLIDGPIGEFG